MHHCEQLHVYQIVLYSRRPQTTVFFHDFIFLSELYRHRVTVYLTFQLWKTNKHIMQVFGWFLQVFEVLLQHQYNIIKKNVLLKIIGLVTLCNSACQVFKEKSPMTECSVDYSEMTCTHTNPSSTAPNILPFSKFPTLEPDAHENRQLQITAPPMSYLCQLLTINGFGTVKARCINPLRLTLS